MLAGWSDISSIELESEYCEIQAARLAWWEKWARNTNKTDPGEILRLVRAAEVERDERQLDMFDALKKAR